MLRTLPEGATLSGVAPKANLVSLKVLDDDGNAPSSVVIQAIDYIRTINSDGRDLQIHGINLSLGCPWPPAEYAAGQSPLCRELDLLTGTGVIAVVSAGNEGAGGTIEGPWAMSTGSCRQSPIPETRPPSSPSDRCIATDRTPTVSRSTPRRGPTLDGRPKPDLVAPGEGITSAATGLMAGVPPLAPVADDPAQVARYIEDSGTSMAAAHVSGAIAAFLSARNEYSANRNW